VDYKQINRKVVAQFRAGGEIPGMHRERLLLLTTTGRRTGESRTTPMMFVRDDDRLVVIASNDGAPRHPDWFRNLEADPHVTAEVGDDVGGDAIEAVAQPATGDERARLWHTVTSAYPFFLEHEERAGRTIPVVVLTPAASASDPR
jgi:deazaflavin-dependent oxidoreductase (nitroreductase family)